MRQMIGWRDYVWHLYWYARRGLPAPQRPGRPRPPAGLVRRARPATRVEARASLHALRGGPRGRLGAPHPAADGARQLRAAARLRPGRAHRLVPPRFVDGYDWVMVPNVVGMSQHADGGFMATKPYAGGGAYINRMSDYCGGCVYDPKVRVGDHACPFTAGYWAFLHRTRPRLAGNPRMRAAPGRSRPAGRPGGGDRAGAARGTAAP